MLGLIKLVFFWEKLDILEIRSACYDKDLRFTRVIADLNYSQLIVLIISVLFDEIKEVRIESTK
jgi:hypothetical protein